MIQFAGNLWFAKTQSLYSANIRRSRQYGACSERAGTVASGSSLCRYY
jgi:hypothetical protein